MHALQMPEVFLRVPQSRSLSLRLQVIIIAFLDSSYEITYFTFAEKLKAIKFALKNLF